jgi:hypothetical protein
MGELRNSPSSLAQAHFLASILAGLYVVRQLNADSSRLDNASEVTLLALAQEPVMAGPVGNADSTRP